MRAHLWHIGIVVRVPSEEKTLGALAWRSARRHKRSSNNVAQSPHAPWLVPAGSLELGQLQVELIKGANRVHAFWEALSPSVLFVPSLPYAITSSGFSSTNVPKSRSQMIKKAAIVLIDAVGVAAMMHSVT